MWRSSATGEKPSSRSDISETLLSSTRSTIISPCAESDVAARRSMRLPSTSVLIWPSCGRRRSAMFMPAITLKRETSAAWMSFGRRIASCSTPSMRSRTRSESASGSRWMSEARSRTACASSRSAVRTIGAWPSCRSRSCFSGCSCFCGWTGIASPTSRSISELTRYWMLIARRISSGMPTAGLISCPVIERSSSTVCMLPGSAMTTSSDAPVRLDRDQQVLAAEVGRDEARGLGLDVRRAAGRGSGCRAAGSASSPARRP